MNDDDVLIQLRVVVLDLDLVIHELIKKYGDNAHKMKYTDGRYILLDALASKAIALAAIAQLENK